LFFLEFGVLGKWALHILVLGENSFEQINGLGHKESLIKIRISFYINGPQSFLFFTLMILGPHNVSERSEGFQGSH